MVASISSMSRGSETYYTQLGREDYYLNGGEPPGRWVGKAAKAIGLTGQVTGKQLSDLLSGFDPQGKKLVRNAGAEKRQVGWDITFSAPKDVSILWGIGNESQRKQIEEAHTKAVEGALNYLQANVVWSRKGAGGLNWVKANAVVATFLHGTSRDVDPNLHTHALFSNVGVCDDGRTRTIISKKLYEHKMVAGLIYRAALAEQLCQDLGFELIQTKSWFQVKGISDEVRDFFSKRSQAIKAVAGDGASQAEKDKAALNTRSVKGHVARASLHPLWQQQAETFGLSADAVQRIFNSVGSIDRKAAMDEFKQGHDMASAELAKSKSFFSSTQLLRAAMEKMKMGQLGVKEVLEAHNEMLNSGELHALGVDQKTRFFSTKQQQDVEDRLLRIADEMSTRIGKPIERQHIKKTLEGSTLNQTVKRAQAFVHGKIPSCLRFSFAKPDYSYLNALQKAAVYQITAETGSIKTVSGRAGTGKTTMLAAAREIWESKGYNVVGCAVSGKAAQELAQGAGISSETVALRLLQFDRSFVPSVFKLLKHESKQLHRAFLNKNRYEMQKFRLNKKSILVIDEASMLSTNDLEKLLSHAQKAGAKVVLTGDIRQLPSIEAGGGFARLFKQTHGYELTESVRQKTPWLKKAANLLAEADTTGALSEFAKAERLSFSDNKGQVQENLIKDWHKNRTRDLRETVILASTNQDVDELNQKVQDERRRNGELGASRFAWGDVNFVAGDRIAFHSNNRKVGVWNGDLGTIKAIVNPITSFAVRFVVELDRGETISFCPRQFQSKTDIALGYATTIHKSQGMTVDKTFLMCDPSIDQELAYVGLTRSRYDTSIHCEAHQLSEDTTEQVKAREMLGKNMERSRQKRLAEDKKRELAEQQRRQQQMQHTHERRR